MKRCAFLFAVLMMTLTAQAQLIIAHRGASADAPENTLPAFELAFTQGADGIEADFYLTRDGQIICMHDKDTKRTSGVALVPAEATLDELRALDAGKWFHEKFTGVKMPTIDEVFAVVPPGKLIFIEIKCGPEIVPALTQAVARSSLKPEQMVIICFKESVVEACRRAMPHIKAQWLTSFKQDKQTQQWTPTLEKVLATMKQINATGVDAKCEPAAFSAEFIAAVKKAGFEAHTWTVNDPELARVFQKAGVDSITTDKPAVIRAALEKR